MIPDRLKKIWTGGMAASCLIFVMAGCHKKEPGSPEIGGVARARPTPSAIDKKPEWPETLAQTDLEEARGRVSSISGTRLVVSSYKEGIREIKEQKQTFTIRGETIKEGKVRPGAEVLVEFYVENGEKVAASVEVLEPTPVPTR